ncbi:MAG: NADH-quinone oxidoreductase subunit NuoG [Candidatus Midichloria mitochondrii]|uniref:NADH-quinone oxidoreductase n=1 Tax=Midichloria mitochondrii (strain IricVA) TaxID=696127 RepID=F7XU87_MIDMI|nr:NADH-quinone oxidoreductase subunit NuoG [Candidatus Midichloria mitochondrii]AEI89446.1 NADH:ubiquinone oxidoreductase subunit G [Candidatus Midichloria mitochondrii IricVA]MDJ1256606.1 NADH-quinone oxidoreductase subunit NuoG [Candidatus Midichloria mitochondrii]MDJ1288326.1 NADH-quinone oxidoreductase subunit NuoG [Candidatus Midichloria mitochondrii]MDJ1299522.1 NADH-quinone oxidoreductase subunit NuoG [Candidatus Midichloria mitochondrii]MDJ1313268.1 NADH-quinone oxidoreductase subunit
MAKLTVNGIEIEVPNGATVLQACEAAGAEIPRFCYHEKLAIAGNCRMCLVEIEKSPKPVASCAQPVAEGMIVHTDTAMVKKAREGVMEFLLINHPLDCPICDQGGECDLQDQALKYGNGYSRFEDEKRAVVDKYMGPLISTNMNRCIHCTRCVRFLEDVAGTNELGAIGRGEDVEITTYIGKAVSSELSGNIIDLCPVGALTAKPYEFQFRSWELKRTNSIDVLDAVGSNIVINSRGTEVMRILPNPNDDINEEWISDKTRFAYDGLKYQRLDIPMIKKDGKLEPCDWDTASTEIKNKILATNPQKVGAVAGDFTDVETMFLAKKLLKSLGSDSYDCRQDGSLLDNSERWFYTFGTTISGIEKADLCLIVGSNPRHEAAIINARIRKVFLHNKTQIALIGEKVDLQYDYKHLGNNPWILKQIAEGEHPFSEQLKTAKNPIIIVGAAVFTRPDFEAFVYYLKKMCTQFDIIRDDWNGFNILHTSASRVGGLDIGFIPESKSINIQNILEDSKVLFLFGADEVDLKKIPQDTFVIYQGHHGDKGAYRADIILPSAAYTEKDSTYVNTEGRVQRTYAAVPPPRYAKSDWEIVNALAKLLKVDLGINSLSELRRAIAKEFSIFQYVDSVIPSEVKINPGKMREFEKDSFTNPNKNFYMSDCISRNSKTMAQCTQEILNKQYGNFSL